MRRHIFYLPFLLLISVSLVTCNKWPVQAHSRNGGRISQVGEVGSPISAPGTPDHVHEKMSSGGIGAWGYVAIILCVLFVGFSVYYGFIFYPILCKKERNYDVMEMTAV